MDKGDTVKEGQVIDVTESTGLSTEPYLHLEILIDGNPLDPKKWNYF